MGRPWQGAGANADGGLVDGQGCIGAEGAMTGPGDGAGLAGGGDGGVADPQILDGDFAPRRQDVSARPEAEYKGGLAHRRSRKFIVEFVGAVREKEIDLRPGGL